MTPKMLRENEQDFGLSIFEDKAAIFSAAAAGGEFIDIIAPGLD